MNANDQQDPTLEAGVGDDAQPATMPLGVGGFGDPDAADQFSHVDAAAKSKRFKPGTLLLLGVVCLAAIGLYSMRSLSTAVGAGGGDEELDNTIEGFLDRLTGGETAHAAERSHEVQMSPDVEQLAMQALVDDRTENQVPLDDVQKNPFIRFLTEGQAESQTGLPNRPAQDSIAVQQAELREKFEQAVAKCRLLMVLGGSNPMANVNGRIVQVGDFIHDDRLDVEFEVGEITSQSVIFILEDESLEFRHEILLPLNRNG